jgi:hypothetical protein
MRHRRPLAITPPVWNTAPHRKPRRRRGGTAENVLFNLGRGVGGFGPLVVGALVAAYSYQAAIALLAGIYVVDIVATVLLIPERRGAALE